MPIKLNLKLYKYLVISGVGDPVFFSAAFGFGSLSKRSVSRLRLWLRIPLKGLASGSLHPAHEKRF